MHRYFVMISKHCRILHHAWVPFLLRAKQRIGAIVIAFINSKVFSNSLIKSHGPVVWYLFLLKECPSRAKLVAQSLHALAPLYTTYAKLRAKTQTTANYKKPQREYMKISNSLILSCVLKVYYFTYWEC